MSWGIINGDERLGGMSGEGNELKFESGKPVRVKLLFDENNPEPYSFFEHTIEVEVFKDGKKTTDFRTVRCPKTKQNPNAPCDLCEGQVSRRRIRHAVNVWVYDQQKVLKLRQGEQVFKAMGTIAKMGTDPASMDWAISKTGSTRNDTEYSAVNVGPCQLTELPAGTTLYNLKEDYKPHTLEEMKAIVAQVGGDWNHFITVPAVQYPATLQEALDHEMPNTKYKGQKMSQIWNENPGMIEWLANSKRISVEKGMAQVILVAMKGVMIPGVPNLSGGNVMPSQPAPQQMPSQPAPQQSIPQQQSAPQQTTGAQVNNSQTKINEINQLFQSSKGYEKDGYNYMIGVLSQASGGTKTAIHQFSDAELDKAIEILKKDQK